MVKVNVFVLCFSRDFLLFLFLLNVSTELSIACVAFVRSGNTAKMLPETLLRALAAVCHQQHALFRVCSVFSLLFPRFTRCVCVCLGR